MFWPYHRLLSGLLVSKGSFFAPKLSLLALSSNAKVTLLGSSSGDGGVVAIAGGRFMKIAFFDAEYPHC